MEHSSTTIASPETKNTHGAFGMGAGSTRGPLCLGRARRIRLLRASGAHTHPSAKKYMEDIKLCSSLGLPLSGYHETQTREDV
jgi:hypothetical protein